jgi:hypothetical protein
MDHSNCICSTYIYRLEVNPKIVEAREYVGLSLNIKTVLQKGMNTKRPTIVFFLGSSKPLPFTPALVER